MTLCAICRQPVMDDDGKPINGPIDDHKVYEPDGALDYIELFHTACRLSQPTIVPTQVTAAEAPHRRDAMKKNMFRNALTLPTELLVAAAVEAGRDACASLNRAQREVSLPAPCRRPLQAIHDDVRSRMARASRLASALQAVQR